MKTKKLALCALFVALVAVCAWLSVPIFDTPITLQSFAVALALLVLGGRQGFVVIGVYLCMGAVGLPVFSGFQGGFGALLGPTGGYLWGFLAMGLAFWAVKKPLLGAILGTVACYACGTAWYALAYADTQGLFWIVAKCVLPYLAPDAIKLWLAYSVSKQLKRVL